MRPGSATANAKSCTWWPKDCPPSRSPTALSITERTVKFHVNSIFHKLGADNRAQAVALAAQRGLL